MNDSIKRISLDLHATGSRETVKVKRSDTGRSIYVSLVDGGVPYYISEDCYAVFTGKKPDGNKVLHDCTIVGNVIIYKLEEQTAAVPGLVNCEIKLYGADDQLITSPKFSIMVDDTVYEEGDEIETPGTTTRVLLSPETAKVGQYLQIEEVSEDGRVVKLEAVDAPEAPPMPTVDLVGQKTADGGEIFNDYENNAAAKQGHAEGELTEAGWRSHAEGYLTLANSTSHSEGRVTEATGKGAHAEGLETYEDVLHNGSKVVTLEATSIDAESFTVGMQHDSNILAIGGYVVLCPTSSTTGFSQTDVRRIVDIRAKNGFDPTVTYFINKPFRGTNYFEGNNAPSDGIIPAGAQLKKAIPVIASGDGAHAEGVGAKASGVGAHAEGKQTEAKGTQAHAEGLKSKAYSTAGHAEGFQTQAGVTPGKVEVTGDTSCAHAEGNNTKAYAFASHAEGQGTIAASSAQHAQGKFNIEDTANKYAHIVGNGTSSTRSNAHTIDWNGNGWFAGDVYVGGSGQDDAKKLATTEYVDANVSNAFSLNKVVCIGDSFLDGYYASPPYGTRPENQVPYGWGEALRDMVKQYNPNAKFTMWYEGGSGFNTDGQAGRDFYDHLANMHIKLIRESSKGSTTMQVGDKENGYKTVDVIAPDDVETVIILGGVNDINAGKTINYGNVVSYAKELFSNAKIVLAMTPLCSKYTKVDETKGKNANEYFSNLTRLSTDPRVCVLTDSYHWLIMDEFFYGDGLHPNKDGYKRIAEHLLHASRGLTQHSEYKYTVDYPNVKKVGDATVPEFGFLSLTFRKVNNTVMLSYSGNVDAIPNGFVIGEQPAWMSRAKPFALNLNGSVGGVVLRFEWNAIWLDVTEQPEPAEKITLKGSAMISLDIL